MADEKKPDEKKPKERKKKVIEPEDKDSILATAAKAVGTAAGKIASLAGAEAGPPPQTKSTKPEKLKKKNKSRLPRRQKKALQKASARKGE